VGTVDFTGDMPIILGPDGPSCGGFVCPATIESSELWKMGQLKAGDRVRFFRVNEEPAVLRGEAPGVVVRADGDRSLLVEFGENRLDFELSFAAHSLRRQLLGTAGIIDLTPGIRSLQIHYDPSPLMRRMNSIFHGHHGAGASAGERTLANSASASFLGRSFHAAGN
jgi:urea carboxylase